MKEVILGYYDASGAMGILSVTRAAVSKIVKAEGWPLLKVGNSCLFHAADVHEYRAHQVRTNLAKALGWRGRGLYRVDDIDISCPVCEAFAVEWPAPPLLPINYLCLNGHKGDV